MRFLLYYLRNPSWNIKSNVSCRSFPLFLSSLLMKLIINEFWTWSMVSEIPYANCAPIRASLYSFQNSINISCLSLFLFFVVAMKSRVSYVHVRGVEIGDARASEWKSTFFHLFPPRQRENNFWQHSTRHAVSSFSCITRVSYPRNKRIRADYTKQKKRKRGWEELHTQGILFRF